MNMYVITFADGAETQEYGDSEQDVREFLARCFGGMRINSIVQL